MSKIKIIHLDAKSTSTLNWNEKREDALNAIAAGHQLLWHLDLGIFLDRKQPLSNTAQFLNLGYAIEHFHKTIWSEFHRFSKGIALYHGSLDFSKDWLWDEEQQDNLRHWLQERFLTPHELAIELDFELDFEIETFNEFDSKLLHNHLNGELLLQLYARDVVGEYLEQLAEKIPDSIEVFMMITEYPTDPLTFALLSNPASFGRVKQFSLLKNRGWNTYENRKEGICLPKLSTVKPSLLTKLRPYLQNPEIKWIPEELLTVAWAGLDRLFYLDECLSKEGRRKMQGFLAAGGEAILI